MGKFNLSKKTLVICILYHNKKLDLSKLISSINDNQVKILIILDGLKKIKNQKKIFKLHRNIIIRPQKKSGISFCRNYGLNFCIKNKIQLLVFLDSDVIACKNVIKNHYYFHKKYKKIPIISGGVIPTFFKKKVNIFTKLDGMLSWLAHIPEKKEKLIKEPFHLATVNTSIKISFVKKFNLFFDERLQTGEDIKFCKDFRSKGFKIMKIPNSDVLHQDRNSFKEVLKHQSLWGRHQFYTVYKFNFLKLGKIFNIFFMCLFPFIMPILSIFLTLISIYPWIKQSLFYIKYIVLIYLLISFKSYYTYLECYDDFKKKLR